MIAPLKRSVIIGLPVFTRSQVRLFGYPLQIIGEVLLLLVSVWIAIRLVKCHGSCARVLRQTMRGVHDADRTDQGK